MNARHLRKCPACLLRSMPVKLVSLNRHANVRCVGISNFQYRQHSDAPHVRERKNGLPSLPLPPLMDQQKINQRAKAKNKPRKPEISAAHLTPFQQALADNPYAQALATPVRTCKVTNANLPSFFLTSFDIKSDPSDASQVSLVPSSLFSQSSRDAPKDPAIATSQVYLNQRENLLATLCSKERISGTASRMMSERMMKEMVHFPEQDPVEEKKKSRRSRRRGGGLGGPNVPVWRSDMHLLIRALLQEAVMNKLVWIFKNLRTGLLVAAPHDAAALPREEGGSTGTAASCILNLRSPTTLEARKQISLQLDKIFREIEWQASEANRLIEAIRHQSDVANDPEFQSKLTDISAAIRIDPARAAEAVHFGTTEFIGEVKTVVAVYSLAEMLEAGQVDELCGLLKGTKLENEASLVVRKDQRTTAAVMALLRLQAYLA